MLAKIDYKPLDKENPTRIREFRLLKDVTLPKFTKELKPEEEQTFKANSIVRGLPIVADIQSTSINGIGRGVLIEDLDGIYIIPRSATTMTEFDQAKGVVKETVESAIEMTENAITQVSKFDTKIKLGFTPKQLLVVGVVAILTFKLLK